MPLNTRRQADKVEQELGLERRFRFSKNSFRGTYRGYRLSVSISGSDEAGGGSGTFCTVFFDEPVIGPAGFRRLTRRERMKRPAVSVQVGRYRFTADDSAQLEAWLTKGRRHWLEANADSANRDFTKIVVRRGAANSPAQLRKHLDRVIDQLDDLRTERA